MALRPGHETNTAVMRGLDPRIHPSSQESFEADGLPGRSPAMTRGEPMPNVEIQPATDADLPAITEIYEHAVLHGTATFELIPPDLAEMTRRFKALMDGSYPYLAAALEGRVIGYAYAGPYRPRPAYRFTVENSVYLASAIHRRGIGTQLLQRLIAGCEARGHRQMIAVIGDSANAGSVGVHTRCGFAMIGTHPNVGFKFGRWLDTVMMQRALGEGATTLPDT
jgi:L-amino acid N-acyltransferase YncA